MAQVIGQRSTIEWNDYLAVAYAEGFCEGEGATAEESIEAWSYICINKLHLNLQGFFGRYLDSLRQSNILDVDGIINWKLFDELMNKEK
jgi:hypothetical protein